MSHASPILVIAFGIVQAWVLLTTPFMVQAKQQEIPEALQPWEDWATWDVQNRNSPPAFNDGTDKISFWPSRLELSADQTQATWRISVRVFSESWIPLPGGQDLWPRQVVTNGESVPVIEREGRPVVPLKPGRYELSGQFRWPEMPQKIAIPKEIGLLSLTVEGKPLPLPDWDSAGQVWLKRMRIAEAEKNLLAVEVYRVLEDGIPTWLRSEIELTVSGTSREEELGYVLPAGWTLATIECPLPIAVDEQGRMKAQVRSGKWTVRVNAFCTADTRELRFAPGTRPITNLELLGFQSKPDFRLAELSGGQSIDVSQTTFPEKWRNLPVYQWDTSTVLRLEEKTRGMGLQRPEGLKINRQFWLDEEGGGITYRDTVTGRMQQIWRLDSATGQQPGSVRVDGTRQLITANPATGAAGIEIRTRNLNLDAIGRISNPRSLTAAGWKVDADSMGITWNLPPGWRALAVFGADEVQGDWLTAWTLLDLFLLLIFSLAVGRIWGIPAGLIAFLAFGLAYHEPAAPRLTWLFLLIPMALLNVVPQGVARKWITIWKYLAIALLLIVLVPFLTRQIQTALYPQLESPGLNYQSRPFWGGPFLGRAASTAFLQDSAGLSESFSKNRGQAPAQEIRAQIESSNLLNDPKAQIQTGPAEPEWKWNVVTCGWDGPVSADQVIRPVLITPNQHRILNVARIGLLSLLAIILFGMVRFPKRRAAGKAISVGLLVLLCLPPAQLDAQEIPNSEMLETLRKRLLEPADVFPHAAEIPAVSLNLEGNQITMEVEVHAAVDVAVPLPGQIPVWSPVSVTLDGKTADLVCRKQGYLWMVVPKGVHLVVVEAVLPDVSEWNWTFLLPPRTVAVTAPGWTVSGIRTDGIPEKQVFFAREVRESEDTASYDRREFNSLMVVDRHLEAGLVWQVRNVVTRLSPDEKAVSLKIPLLPNESVLTSSAIVNDGFVEVRLSAGQKSFSWTSDLPVGEEIQMLAPQTNQWVERWHLTTSPVWNVSATGLPPIFETNQQRLVPVWHPWPAEEVSLVFDKPVPVTGETVTVQRLRHETSLGSRQRTEQLEVELECSLGGDFPIQLDATSEISSVQVAGKVTPVRRDGSHLIIPVQPGKQTIEIAWRSNATLGKVFHSQPIQLPVASANITSTVRVPESRWVLWTDGPARGPAVQFWVILIFAIFGALILGGFSRSPLSRIEWVLLVIGLTQVHIVAAMIVVAWLYLLAWRGKSDPGRTKWWVFDFGQIGLVLLTVVVLGILIEVVRNGLLGQPEMFIAGNGSRQTFLQWFQPRDGVTLPSTTVISVSVWFYRLLMLLWALWLAAALLRWFAFGWKSFCRGGAWRHRPVATQVSESVTLPAND